MKTYLEDNVYAGFYEVEEPVIKYIEGKNEIQYVQRNLGKIAEEQVKDKVWSEVIKWVEKKELPYIAETQPEEKWKKF